MMGFYLAIDTSTEACSVAAWLDGTAIERFEPMQREHTRRVLPMVRELLAQCGRGVPQLDGLVCGIGPGSFAGLRIGVGVVKGLALARDLPVVGVSSLAMLAQRAIAGGATHVAAVIDARMHEVYFGAYRRGAGGLADNVAPDMVGAAASVPALEGESWVGVGTGWGRYEAELRKAVAVQIGTVDAAALPHARDALALGVPAFAAGRAVTAAELAPAYLRDRVALTLDEQRRLRE